MTRQPIDCTSSTEVKLPSDACRMLRLGVNCRDGKAAAGMGNATRRSNNKTLGGFTLDS